MRDDRYDTELVEDILVALEEVPLSDYYVVADLDRDALCDPDVKTDLGIGSITEGPGEHSVVDGYGKDLSEMHGGDGWNPFRYKVAEDEVYVTVTFHPEPLAGETSTYAFQRTEDGMEVTDTFANVYY